MKNAKPRRTLDALKHLQARESKAGTICARRRGRAANTHTAATTWHGYGRGARSPPCDGGRARLRRQGLRLERKSQSSQCRCASAASAMRGTASTTLPPEAIDGNDHAKARGIYLRGSRCGGPGALSFAFYLVRCVCLDLLAPASQQKPRTPTRHSSAMHFASQSITPRRPEVEGYG